VIVIRLAGSGSQPAANRQCPPAPRPKVRMLAATTRLRASSRPLGGSIMALAKREPVGRDGRARRVRTRQRPWGGRSSGRAALEAATHTGDGGPHDAPAACKVTLRARAGRLTAAGSRQRRAWTRWAAVTGWLVQVAMAGAVDGVASRGPVRALREVVQAGGRFLRRECRERAGH
jgi:hypothetical protein